MRDFQNLRQMMVDTQIRPSDVTRYSVIRAMLEVPRERFVPQSLREVAYSDASLQMGSEREMLAPRIVGKLLDLLEIEPGELVLNIGAGTGYTAALLAQMTSAVVALEQDEYLAKEAGSVFDELELDRIVVLNGNASEGAAKHGPYDAILIEGAIDVFPDKYLAPQLREGGRIAAIFRKTTQPQAYIGIKSDEKISWRYAFDADAAPLPGFEAEERFVL